MTISVYTEVEADTKEQAIELAKDRPKCMLTDPARNGESSEEVWCHTGELDGEPCNVVAEEM